MGCNGNCDLELHAFGDRYHPRCNDDGCKKCNHEERGNSCKNSITVTTDNVLWNGCGLRYIKSCPGKPVSEMLEDTDRLIGDLYCKFTKFAEYIETLENRVKILEAKANGKL